MTRRGLTTWHSGNGLWSLDSGELLNAETMPHLRAKAVSRDHQERFYAARATAFVSLIRALPAALRGRASILFTNQYELDAERGPFWE
ncbi:uncharacterized protein N7503_004232 [Penicillium pulvis]|uniref:uncharacterized protein n=1 Tax=Penicillium pulvis TaxID=1562058 RepID=UPI002548F98D|nr:uncharacterized protein N7503_004232 [Penicillium pulvis]KAJ5806630.1 hypothetical protein N7503_004232 [Penicillium pulvis]